MRQNHNHIRTLFYGVVLASSFLFVPVQALAEIVISQVQITGGPGKTAEDFVELHNPGSEPLSLKGFRLVKRTASGTADVTLKSWTQDAWVPAGGFYLWANSGFISIPSSPDAATSGTIADDNGVGLRQGDEDVGVLVDSLAWGSAANSFRSVSSENPGPGQSLRRQELGNPDSAFTIGDSAPRNTNTTGTVPTTTPPTASTTPETQQPPVAPPGTGSQQPAAVTRSLSIKISELLPNPEGEDEDREQVELENTGSEPVDVGGWYLGDKTETGVKENAYRLPSLVIPPGALAAITVPKGKFVLNNSGGDAVNLYFSDKTLADSVRYEGSAPEGKSYQRTGSQWRWGDASLGSANAVPALEAAETVKLWEIMPNPAGSDEGNEWVELYNSGESPVDLGGFSLDDAGTADEPGSSAWVMGGGTVIPPHGYKAFTIPEDRFNLGNSGTDTVRLFNPAKRLLEAVSYAKAPEDRSLSRSATGDWQWGFPTPGKENIIQLPDYRLTVSEILPNPGSEDDEFIELQNIGTAPVPLGAIIVRIGTRKIILEGSEILQPGAYHVLYADEYGFSLRNSGQTVSVLDGFGRELSQLSYPKAAVGRSYNDVSGRYEWSSQLTPGKPNEIVLGISVAREQQAAKEAKLAVTKKASAKDKASEPERDRETLDKAVALETATQAQTDRLAHDGEEAGDAPPTAAQPAAAGQERKRGYGYLVLSAAAFLGLVVALVFLLKNPSAGDGHTTQ